jgi:hypothetical protein
MALGAIHPGSPPRDAFAAIVDGLLAASGAAALPTGDAVRGRPFSRYPDAAAFEAACYGRALSGG